jgi:hypothetical protein
MSMLTNLNKAPFVYFGGKSQAAPLVWAALGDPSHFVEPFCGSAATLLLRPHPCNRPYYSETVNDKDGLLVNALRALAFAPDETADAASWYVSELDIMARHLAVLAWANDPDNVLHLAASVTWCDPVIAGYWLHGICCWIGSGYASGEGPWIVGADGRLTKRERKTEPGVARQLPHLGDNGQGVNRPQAREPGVARQLPHLGDNGRGVNRPQAREPGGGRGRA